jgi:hypothetical protein
LQFFLNFIAQALRKPCWETPQVYQKEAYVRALAAAMGSLCSHDECWQDGGKYPFESSRKNAHVKSIRLSLE